MIVIVILWSRVAGVEESDEAMARRLQEELNPPMTSRPTRLHRHRPGPESQVCIPRLLPAILVTIPMTSSITGCLLLEAVTQSMHMGCKLHLLSIVGLGSCKTLCDLLYSVSAMAGPRSLAPAC